MHAFHFWTFSSSSLGFYGELTSLLLTSGLTFEAFQPFIVQRLADLSDSSNIGGQNAVQFSRRRVVKTAAFTRLLAYFFMLLRTNQKRFILSKRRWGCTWKRALRLRLCCHSHIARTPHVTVNITQSACRPLKFIHNRVTSPNLVWISNKLNAWWTFKHCISQLATLIETILTQRVERSVYCKLMVLLFLLAASYGIRGSDMGHLWFVVQIGAKWSYKTIIAAWVHYNHQYNILELEKKAQIQREIWCVQFWKNGLAGSNVQTVENTLWTRSQCCLALLAI